MNIIQKIKYKAGIIFLNRKLKQNSRTKKFCNFLTAKNIGIIFNASQQDIYKTTIEFIKYLNEKNISVNAIGYVTNKESLAYFQQKKEISFFSLKNTNWFGKPKNNNIDDFIEKPFDILINLCKNEIYTLQYINALSVARMKISAEFPENNYTDFRIKAKADTPHSEFINIIKHYLNTIK